MVQRQCPAGQGLRSCPVLDAGQRLTGHRPRFIRKGESWTVNGSPIQTMNTKFTKHGPGGLSVRFDSTEIFPDDPGQGTPVLVFLGNESSTFCCALNEGEVDGTRLSPAQIAFLQTLETFVWNFTSH